MLVKEITFEKPVAKVIGQDGNVFNILGICSKSLKRSNIKEKEELSKEMTSRVFKSESYDEALNIMMEYVEFH